MIPRCLRPHIQDGVCPRRFLPRRAHARSFLSSLVPFLTSGLLFFGPVACDSPGDESSGEDAFPSSDGDVYPQCDAIYVSCCNSEWEEVAAECTGTELRCPDGYTQAECSYGPCYASSPDGDTCPEVSYCRFGEGSCGLNDEVGFCTRRPESCDGRSGEPVCGCDGLIYSNWCEAQSAGVDISASGGCTFSCGSDVCDMGMICRHDVSDVVGVPDTFRCPEIPSSCVGSDDLCACLVERQVTCSGVCSIDALGNVTLTCPEGCVYPCD